MALNKSTNKIKIRVKVEKITNDILYFDLLSFNSSSLFKSKVLISKSEIRLETTLLFSILEAEIKLSLYLFERTLFPTIS